jgi:hypothetical protein
LGDILPVSPELLLLAAAQGSGGSARSTASSSEEATASGRIGSRSAGASPVSKGGAPSFLVRAFGGGGGGGPRAATMAARPASSPALFALAAQQEGAIVRQQQQQPSRSPSPNNSNKPPLPPPPQRQQQQQKQQPPQRRAMAEQARPVEIAKGFGVARHQWWALLGRTRSIDVWPIPPPSVVASGSSSSAFCGLGLCLKPPPPSSSNANDETTQQQQLLAKRRSNLLQKVPDAQGIYVWLVKPPRSRGRLAWVPVYLGKSDRLRQRLASYLRPDGGFGPADEPFKRKAMLDLMRRGFAVQVRFRPAKISPSKGGAKADESAKLARWDFPLNAAENGGRRPIELPSGRRVGDYPIVDQRAARLYENAVAKERAVGAASGDGSGVGAAGGGAGGGVPLALVRKVLLPSAAAKAAGATGAVVAVVASATGGR